MCVLHQEIFATPPGLVLDEIIIVITVILMQNPLVFMPFAKLDYIYYMYKEFAFWPHTLNNSFSVCLSNVKWLFGFMNLATSW